MSSESVTFSVDFDQQDHGQEEQSWSAYGRKSSSDHQSVQVQETPREKVNPCAAMQDLLTYLIQYQGDANTSSWSTPQPDFLNIVTISMLEATLGLEEQILLMLEATLGLASTAEKPDTTRGNVMNSIHARKKDQGLLIVWVDRLF